MGSHLVDLLLENPDNDITIVDNMQSAAVGFEHFGDRVHIAQMSVGDFFTEATPHHDQIYHLASVVGPVGVLSHAGRIIQSIVNDTYKIADAAEAWGARIVDVSTSEVYGGGQQGLCSEDMPKIITNKTSARLEYAIGKLAAETALINLGVNAVIIRPFNIAGPRQKPDGGFVLPRFIAAAKQGEPLTVYGDGSQVRAFTHVKDIAEGLMAAMKRGILGEAYNIGNAHNKVTILQLAEKVREVTKSRSLVKFVDPKTLWGPDFEEAADKYPDSSKAESELDWRATRSLENIIADAL